MAGIARSTDQDNAHIHLTNQKQINTTVMLQLFYDDFLSCAAPASAVAGCNHNGTAAVL